MAHVHLVLQCRDGIGKSFIAALLAQYTSRVRGAPLCIDTDPVQATLASYPALAARRLPLVQGRSIHPRHFSTLLQWLAAAPHGAIIDTPARGLMPLTEHLVRRQVPKRLRRLGQRLIVHIVVSGGVAWFPCLEGMAHILERLGDQAPCVLWLNPFHGPLEFAGQGLEQWSAYTAHRHRVAAIVPIPPLPSVAFGNDLQAMLQERLTFAEALAMDSRSLLTRQRLQTLKARLFAQIDNALVL